MTRRPRPRPENPSRAVPRPPTPDLRLRAAADNGRALLHVVGEIDQESAPRLRRALETLLGDGASHVYVDLEGVTFCDSTGLHALLHARTQALAEQVELTLAPGAAVLRLLEITETAALFTLRTAEPPADHSSTPQAPAPRPSAPRAPAPQPPASRPSASPVPTASPRPPEPPADPPAQR
ncbi:STAS domain-containing protein [Streptodolium elevatio]|uniref:Anti-sigma factor antagonist n=1 Tax=Streptodolium elevatio TaxID=3157996 RepID=A0ABV3DCK4_9ACTN